MKPYYETKLGKLYKGDCLEIMPQLDIKFDAVITDPPYGTTACKWDSVIPFKKHMVIQNKIMYEDEYLLHSYLHGVDLVEAVSYFEEESNPGMWENINKFVKKNGAVVLFGSEPFSSALRMSNIKNYKYDWVWDKKKPSTGLHAKIMPLRKTEDVVVFGEGKINYYPQMVKSAIRVDKSRTANNGEAFGGAEITRQHSNNGVKYPKNIIEITNANQNNRKHPTQKPLKLIEYLIKTYTNENDIILDFTAGSGTLGHACENLNRRWVMIEKDEDEKYCEIIANRIEKETRQLMLF